MVVIEQLTGGLRTINLAAPKIRGADGSGERTVRIRAHGMPVMQSSEIHYPFRVWSERHQVGIAAYPDLAFTWNAN